MADHIVSFLHDLRTGARSLAHAKGLTTTVIVTLALGIGANAAMFSLLRGILLRPLVNRDEDRLIYIRQSSQGSNATFSLHTQAPMDFGEERAVLLDPRTRPTFL
jgi:hypothetical protein